MIHAVRQGVGLDTSKAARLSGGRDRRPASITLCSRRILVRPVQKGGPRSETAGTARSGFSGLLSCFEQPRTILSGTATVGQTRGRACKENRKAPVRRGSRGELARRSSNRRRGGPGRQRRRKGRRTSWSCCLTMLGFPISAATARRSAPQRSTGSRLRGCATPGFTRPQYARRREQRSSPGATTIRSASGAWRISIAAFPAIAARSPGRPGRSPKC